MTTAPEVVRMTSVLRDSAQLSTLPDWTRKEYEQAADLIDTLAARVRELEGENVAPWPDFAGNPIRAGDTIRHPVDGMTGVVVRLPIPGTAGDQWRVMYGDGQFEPPRLSRLCLQVGHKGQAVVIDAARATGTATEAEIAEAEAAFNPVLDRMYENDAFTQEGLDEIRRELDAARATGNGEGHVA